MFALRGGRSITAEPLASAGGTEGNHRLTALTGSALMPLLALVFLTGLAMDAWWHVHYVIGFVLISVVALKLMTTGYRALRYYTGSRSYRAAGPPHLFPRLLAPFLVTAIVTALVSGVALFLEASRSGTLSTVHTDSSVISAVLLGIHLLTYLPDALMTSARDLVGRLPVRISLVVVAVLVGVILAALTYGAGVWPARQRDPGLRVPRGASGREVVNVVASGLGL